MSKRNGSEREEKNTVGEREIRRGRYDEDGDRRQRKREALGRRWRD